MAKPQPAAHLPGKCGQGGNEELSPGCSLGILKDDTEEKLLAKKNEFKFTPPVLFCHTEGFEW